MLRENINTYPQNTLAIFPMASNLIPTFTLLCCGHRAKNEDKYRRRVFPAGFL